MKQICETNTRDFIIQYRQGAKKKGTDIIWKNEAANIAEMQNKVADIIFYHQLDNGMMVEIKLTKFELQQIQGVIEHIEAEAVEPAFFD